ncbi:MAG: Rne/Rng family ribonuclease [Desulfatibacillaceae bacterium]|nr:Rne/Rng family ribonuclease [Desulfatibacillaceae bacterium]
MSSQILVNAVDPEECRIAIVKDKNLEGFHIETAAREIIRGNIYKGVITRVEQSLQAVFVDFGADRHGFLQKQEIHSDYFQDTPDGKAEFKRLLKPGQEVMVQVLKDPIDKKGAMLSTYISLPGRYVVLMPGSPSRGVSRKIEDEEDRQQLKTIVEEAKLPEGFGLIVRTAAKSRGKTVIIKDINNLLRLWKTINAKGISEGTPSLLYKDQSLAIRALRDYYTPEITQVIVDDPAVYNEVKDFMKIISPRREKLVRLHKDDQPLFSKYGVESQIDSIFKSRVNLKSGGTIVISPTEALVAVDVNSGKSTKESNVEKTAWQTNLEAAEEIARQLRLRDLGGLIVLDFIDMRDRKHCAEVEKALRQHLKVDKARTKVGKISAFGLLEMSRQRLRPSIDYGSYTQCPHCHGKGLIPSAETMALSFLRKLRIETMKDGVCAVTGTVPESAADYLQNKKRREIAELEKRRSVNITIRGDSMLKPGESKILTENSS